MADLSRQIIAGRTRLGLTQGQLAVMLGVSQPTVSRWESGSEPEYENIQRLRALGILSDVPVVTSPQSTVRVVGEVQAGRWLLSVELPPEDQVILQIPLDPRLGPVNRVGFWVRGPSMNRVFTDGSIIICVSTFELGRSPKPGEYVLVQRRDEFDHFEITVKEYAIDAETGVPYLWPRSTHPDHQQPIRFPAPDADDPIEHATATAIVIASYRLEGLI